MSKYEKPYPIDTRPFIVVKRNPDRIEVRQATTKGFETVYRGGVFDSSYTTSVFRRGRVQRNGNVCGTITAASAETLLIFIGICKRNANK